MKRFILAFALAAFASSAFGGNDGPAVLDSREQMHAISEYNRQMDAVSLRMGDFNGSQHGRDAASRNSLTKLRRELAKTWQSLGLSPPAARTVAWAYRPHLSPNSPRVSLQGKTNEQFATLIQSSLASKNYQLANETLIDFVTKKMKLGMNDSPDGNKR